MGELLCVDFKTRSKTYTRVAEQKPPHEITMAEIEAEIGAALWGTCPETLIYESSLRHVLSDTAPSEYCAPAIDPA